MFVLGAQKSQGVFDRPKHIFKLIDMKILPLYILIFEHDVVLKPIDCTGNNTIFKLIINAVIHIIKRPHVCRISLF